MIQRVKRTLRQRSKSTDASSEQKKGTKTVDDAEAPSKITRVKAAITNRTRSIGIKISISKECNTTTSKGSSRESDQKTKNSVLSSVDMEEDPEAPVQTPDLMMIEIKKEELKEKKEKEKKDEEKRERQEDRKEERKENKREDKKEEKKEEKKEVRKDCRENSVYFMERSDEKGVKKKHSKKHSKQKTKMWLGMPSALNFCNKNNDIQKIREEFGFLDSLVCNKTTEAFEANKVRNREGCPKIYDENRVQLNRPGHEDVNYINASVITLTDFEHKLIVAQLPQMENESFVEDFWYMIYQEQIHLVYLMVPDDKLKNTTTSLFNDENGGYQYTGKMFINNRRADVSGDPKEYTIEVLPEGNSDSVICQVHHHAPWKHLQQPPKTLPIIKMIHQFLSEKQVQNAGVCVVSLFGCGRACSFIGALYAINQLNNGIEPNICEIMKNIKQQRPGGVESFAQYASIYAIVFDYIARKRGGKKAPVNKDINRFIDELAEISPACSPTKVMPLSTEL